MLTEGIEGKAFREIPQRSGLVVVICPDPGPTLPQVPARLAHTVQASLNVPSTGPPCAAPRSTPRQARTSLCLPRAPAVVAPVTGQDSMRLSVCPGCRAPAPEPQFSRAACRMYPGTR